MGSCTAVNRVILVQLGPQPPRFHPDDGVETGIVLVVPAEDRDSNHVLLDLIALSRHRPLDDIAKEPAHPVGVGEHAAPQETIELEANLFG